MAPGRVSPARRQAPHPRRDQFNRVAGGIAEIEGPTTPTPGFLVFDRDLVLSEPLPPGAEVLGGDPQREMAWSVGAVRREAIAVDGRLGPKHQQHVAVPHLEEDMPS